MALTLDFTGLKGLALADAKKDFKDAPDTLEEPVRGKPCQPIQNALEALKGLKTAPEATGEAIEGKALISLAREKEDRQRIADAYKVYQENIRKSGSLRTDILKGVQTGEPAHTLLLKAVECISRMTGDTLFYSQIEGNIKAIYGQGLLDPISLQIELQETQERLTRLREAE